MNTAPCALPASAYKGHRFPAEIISRCVWLYFRFSLSLRDVEKLKSRFNATRNVTQTNEWTAFRQTLRSIPMKNFIPPMVGEAKRVARRLGALQHTNDHGRRASAH